MQRIAKPSSDMAPGGFNVATRTGGDARRRF
jgi:hypothetical protein